MVDSPSNFLSYSAPRTFFEGTCRTMTVWTVLAAVGLTAIGLAILARFPLRSAMGLVALAAWGLSAWCLVLPLIHGTRVPLRITEDGVEFGREFYDWREVGRIGGNLYLGDRVEMFVDWRNAIPSHHPLPTTPPLRRPEYVRLMTVVKAYLAEHHPHVEVETLEARPS